MQISNVRLGGVRMLGIEQYKKIQKLKKIGLSKVKVSQQTNLSYKTICNYWNMNENYFINKLKEHEFILVNYRQYIIEILKICPQINNTVLLKRIALLVISINVCVRRLILITNRALFTWKEMKVDTHLIETLQKRLIADAQVITLN